MKNKNTLILLILSFFILYGCNQEKRIEFYEFDEYLNHEKLGQCLSDYYLNSKKNVSSMKLFNEKKDLYYEAYYTNGKKDFERDYEYDGHEYRYKYNEDGNVIEKDCYILDDNLYSVLLYSYSDGNKKRTVMNNNEPYYEEEIIIEKSETKLIRNYKTAGITKPGIYSIQKKKESLYKYNELSTMYSYAYEKDFNNNEILISGINKDGEEKKLSEYKINYMNGKITSYDKYDYDYETQEKHIIFQVYYEDYDEYGNWHKKIKKINNREKITYREINY